MATRTPIVINGNSKEVLQSGDTLPWSALPVVGGVLGGNPSEAQYLLPWTGTTNSAAANTISTAYFGYVGYTTKDLTIVEVSYLATAAGTAALPEIGVFSSSTGLDGGNKTQTKIAAVAQVSATVVGVNKITGLSWSVPANTHLWYGYRPVGTTAATTINVTISHGRLVGAAQSLASAASLVSATTTWAATVATGTGTNGHPAWIALKTS